MSYIFQTIQNMKYTIILYHNVNNNNNNRCMIWCLIFHNVIISPPCCLVDVVMHDLSTNINLSESVTTYFKKYVLSFCLILTLKNTQFCINNSKQFGYSDELMKQMTKKPIFTVFTNIEIFIIWRTRKCFLMYFITHIVLL